MSQDTLVAFDSNVLSYFLQANQAGYDPASDPDPVLAAERVAAFRLFLYMERAFVVPTVEREAKCIRDAIRRDEHLRFIRFQFDQVLEQNLDANWIRRRTSELARHHADEDDCRAVAEAEGGTMEVFVTFDGVLKAHLQAHATVALRSPSEQWTALRIPRGTPPHWQPRRGHPLHGADWWRW